MKQDISVSKFFTRNSVNELVVGTHSGIFHSDDVIGIALYCIKNSENKIHVVRSRDLKELGKCDLLIDIGAGKFDHHQIGGNGHRINGVPYASAGLYWCHYGKEIIKELAKHRLDVNLTEAETNSIFNFLDENIIQEIDKCDNGIKALPTPLDYIVYFLPNWKFV